MRNGRMTTAGFACLVLLLQTIGGADVKLPHIISDNMMLQRGKAVPIWGDAEAGEQITVTIASQKKLATAGADGKWRVKLDPLDAGGPLEMTIAGKNAIVVKNILVGEVWLCSGQSNMEFAVTNADGAAEAVAHADDPQLRLYQVERPSTHRLPKDPRGESAAATGKTVGGFSAVGYYFARQIRKTLNVPVGMIDCTIGGSTALAWAPRDALAKNPVFKPMLDESWDRWIAANDDYDAKMAAYPNDVAAANAAGKPAPPQPAWPPVPFAWNRPGTVYESMVTPLVPFGIRGVLWYQGEANAPRAHLYRQLFPTLIQSWRDAWAEGDFPFLFVQLAQRDSTIPDPATPPKESEWGELREAQTMTLASVKYTGMAISLDTTPPDLHPRNKRAVGERLALIAEAKVYGRDVIYAGPTYESMKVEGNKIRITLANAKGLVVQPTAEAAPKGFAIAGADRKWVWANAKIDPSTSSEQAGESIVVWSDQIVAPVAVRYAWSDVPVVNLYNGAGLPAAPFRTDDWEGITEKNSFVPADQL